MNVLIYGVNGFAEMIKLSILRREDYHRRTSVLRSLCRKDSGVSKSEGRRFEDTMLLTLKMEEEVISKRMRADSEAGKSKETDSSLETPVEINPCYHLDFIPVGPLTYLFVKYKFMLF